MCVYVLVDVHACVCTCMCVWMYVRTPCLPLSPRQLVDCYMEAYHLTPDPHERSHLADVIYDIISSRPRYNPDAAYFSTCYHDEIDLLRTHSELMESILSRQLMDERDYCQLMGNSLSGTNFSRSQFGMPLPLVAKQQVSLIGEESTLCPAYLLEVCPSLSMASHLYYSLKGASEEAVSATVNVTMSLSVIQCWLKSF